MEATIVTWDEAKLEKGQRILMQGALMKYLRDHPDAADDDTRLIEVEYKGMEMEMTVFRKYLLAVIKDE